MKSTMLNLVVVLLLTAVGGGAAELVMDVDGKPVNTTSRYHILPATSSSDAGGITLRPQYKSKKSCPLYVSQTDDEANYGRSIWFRPPTEGTVTVSTDINLEFDSADDTCKQSTVWQMRPAEKDGWQFVNGGGVKGSPGIQTVRNWFKIVKAADAGDNVYKLAYCPAVCGGGGQCKVECGELSVFIGPDGQRLLAIAPPSLKPNPILVKFEDSLT